MLGKITPKSLIKTLMAEKKNPRAMINANCNSIAGITKIACQLMVFPSIARRTVRKQILTNRGTSPVRAAAMGNNSVLKARFLTSPDPATTDVVALNNPSEIASQGPNPAINQIAYPKFVSAPGILALKT